MSHLIELQEDFKKNRLSDSDKVKKCLRSLCAWIGDLYEDAAIRLGGRADKKEVQDLVCAAIAGNKVNPSDLLEIPVKSWIEIVDVCKAICRNVLPEPTEGWKAANETRQAEQERLRGESSSSSFTLATIGRRGSKDDEEEGRGTKRGRDQAALGEETD